MDHEAAWRTMHGMTKIGGGDGAGTKGAEFIGKRWTGALEAGRKAHHDPVGKRKEVREHGEGTRWTVGDHAARIAPRSAPSSPRRRAGARLSGGREPG